MEPGQLDSYIWKEIARFSKLKNMDLVNKTRITDQIITDQIDDPDIAIANKIAYSFYLQKYGYIKLALEEILPVINLETSPIIEFEAKLCLAKIMMQQGKFKDAVKKYEEIGEILESGELELESDVHNSRDLTLYWRKGFSLYMSSGNKKKASALFGLHKERARSGTGQSAVNCVFGKSLPQLYSEEINTDTLDEAIDSTSCYNYVDIKQALTNPDLSYIQRYLLNIIRSALVKDTFNVYYYLWVTAYSLLENSATLYAEGISEFSNALNKYCPFATQFLYAVLTGDKFRINQLINNSSDKKIIRSAQEKAINYQIKNLRTTMEKIPNSFNETLRQGENIIFDNRIIIYKSKIIASAINTGDQVVQKASPTIENILNNIKNLQNLEIDEFQDAIDTLKDLINKHEKGALRHSLLERLWYQLPH